jgi:hypothetical protein
MFNVGGVPQSASYVARQIYLVSVEDAPKETLKHFRSRIPDDKHDLFLWKLYLYCEAAALRILLTENEKDPRYDELVREFEKLVFPCGASQEGASKLEAIKFAMKELDRLFSEKKELSWSRRWFNEIGHDETNPAALSMFALFIMEDTTSLRELIHEIGPPSE